MTIPPNSPTPDYGTLGPGSDIKLGPDSKLGPDLKRSLGLFLPTGAGQPGVQRPGAPVAVVLAMAGALLALGLFVTTRSLTNVRHAQNEVRTTSSRLKYDSAAQKEAEQLLERAARNDMAATRQMEERAAGWHGRIQLTPQLTNLIGAGLNANHREVRAATIRVDLAAMNVSEDASSVNRLASQADSRDHATRIWALWTLGLLASRGIETNRIIGVLTAHLSDPDVEARRWAVEGLAYAATDATISPLLKAMHDDPSPLVRERAACSLAQSGMLTGEQRRTAIPTLLLYVDDASLDAATHAWAYHALRDITGQNLPNDSAAWRRWYEGSR